MNVNRFSIYLTLYALCVWGLFACGSKQEESHTITDVNIQYDAVDAATNATIRGLFLVNDKVGWASGTGGTFMRMTDGMTWKADTIAGFTHLDFRDVHAFDEKTALVMAAGNEGRILRTEDGGVSWVEVYTRLDSGIFLDGMDFYGMTGYCYGDPIDGKFVVIRSKDYGKTWTEFPSEELPEALPNEAGFAASGTGIVVSEKGVWFGTGGDSVSRVFGLHYEDFEWSATKMTVRSGEGCGIFSMALRQADNIIAVGGCYLDSTNADHNYGMLSFYNSTIPNIGRMSMSTNIVTTSPPRGYRSCVAVSGPSNLLVTCGRTGVDYSVDAGLEWLPITDEGYYTCSLGKSSGWLMGKRGKMAKLSW